MRTRTLIPLLALFLALAHSALAAARIPLEEFFKDFTFDEIKVSPDGTKVAALSKWKEHTNLFVVGVKEKRPLQLTSLDALDVAEVQWVTNDTLIFTTVDDGYGTGGLFAIDADGKNPRTLGKSVDQQSAKGAVAIRETAYLAPFGDSKDEILVTSNERRLYEPDVYRMNIHTGIKKRVATNPGDVRAWVADHAGVVRVGYGQIGRKRFLVYREKQNDDWKRIREWDFAKGDNLPLEFDAENRLLYVSTEEGHDTAAIVLFDPVANKVVKELYSDPTYDVDGPILARTDHRLLGFSLNAERPRYVWTDPEVKNIQEMLDGELKGTLNEIYSHSDDEQWLVVLAHSDRDPGTFYLFNYKELTMEKLISRADWIKPAEMAEMKPIVYTARDGLKVHGYLTLPAGVPAKNLPLIVNPHGGPWYRDSWGFNREVQFLASRGFAVLQMNFRGSTGYGLKHLQAGYGQWGLSMQDDITDGVKWCIEQGIADPKRIAIYGASYGGYATMAGLAFTPELYRCGVNYVGVADVDLLMKTIPEKWEFIREQMKATTGDSKKDRERLDATSPLKHVDNIHVPVFLAYGEQDDRIDIKHATRLASALKSHGVPVEWMVRADEGHGYRHWKNKIAFYEKLEEFLTKNTQ